MTPEAVVQRQFEAANAHDIDRFIAEFADDAGLIERGFDSLSATRLAWDLQRAYGRTVPAYDLLDCDSLHALAARMVQS